MKRTDCALLSRPPDGVLCPSSTPLWVRPCPGGCEDAWCSLHGMHAFECECPPIEEMAFGFNPYEER